MFWILLDFAIIGQYVEYWATHSWSATLDGLVGFCEIAALAMIWLIYFSPRFYRRWIAGATPAARPEEA